MWGLEKTACAFDAGDTSGFERFRCHGRDTSRHRGILLNGIVCFFNHHGLFVMRCCGFFVGKTEEFPNSFPYFISSSRHKVRLSLTIFSEEKPKCSVNCTECVPINEREKRRYSHVPLTKLSRFFSPPFLNRLIAHYFFSRRKILSLKR